MFNQFYRKFGKNLLDLSLTVIALIFLSPILLLIMFLVQVKLGSPIFFCQQRPGYWGKPFTLFKFRTMTDACDSQGNLLPDEERLTRFGRFLRTTSLDELPELINVLRGEMSLVGPRPLLPEYLSRYSYDASRRHNVLPGLTGWAQINGRNAITWEKKFALDVWYVDNLSFWVDTKIIILTLWKLIRRDGINQAGQATVEKFT